MAKLRNQAELVAAARGDGEVDLLLVGGEIFSTTTREWIRTDLAIHDGVIVGWGHRDAKTVIDVGGAKLTPGFIDAHMHIESTKMWASSFVDAVLPWGTTAAALDPHEIANVFGTRGVLALARSAEKLPFTFGICASPCVPASPFESSGADLGVGDIESLLTDPAVIGVAEMMNFPGVINGDPEVLGKISAAGTRRVDGHAPGVRGNALDAYLTAGVESDHECTSFDEAHEKRQKGMWIFVRQGSTAKNVADLAPSIIEFGTTRAALCTDDREPNDIVHLGHINDVVRVAVASGITLEDALVMATINTADYHGFHHLGSLAPGFQADVLVFKDISTFTPSLVFQRGQLVAQDGTTFPGVVEHEAPPFWMEGSVRTLHPSAAADFDLGLAEGDHVRVIRAIDDSVMTGELLTTYPYGDGTILNRLAVIERHRLTGRRGVGLVAGFDIERGAIASTVAHDAHNIMVVGGIDATSASDMALAVNTLVEMGGGQVVCLDGEVLARVALPVGGLMSLKDAHEIADELEVAIQASLRLGSSMREPFMVLSFLGLSVIPELRLTDKGLVDVRSFELTSVRTT